MREILFRGKNVRKPMIGRWVRGHYVPYVYENGGLEYLILKPFCGTNGVIMQRFQVDPETVSQYTGFVDRHGDRIFDGDILKYVIPDPPHADSVGYAEVIWDNGWKLQFKGHEPEETDQEDLSKYTEIVGNIWDTPELLGVKR